MNEVKIMYKIKRNFHEHYVIETFNFRKFVTMAQNLVNHKRDKHYHCLINGREFTIKEYLKHVRKVTHLIKITNYEKTI